MGMASRADSAPPVRRPPKAVAPAASGAVRQDHPWHPATVLGLLFERLIVRKMVDASRISVAVATVGLLLFLLSFGFRVFGESPRSVRPPISGHGLTLAGVVVSPTQILSLVITLVVALGLATLLKKTDFGLGVLAAAWWWSRR